jgi:hypothetical protein
VITQFKNSVDDNNGRCRLTGYWIGTPAGVRQKVSNQGSSIDYLLIATLSLRTKREGSYIRIARTLELAYGLYLAIVVP